MASIKELESIVKLAGLYVKRSEFVRNDSEITDYELNIGFTKKVSPNNGDGKYTVELAATIENTKREFSLEIVLVGLFSITNAEPEIEKILINNNAVAIMFPYVRSQVSILTSGPGLMPIVIPPININELLSDEPGV